MDHFQRIYATEGTRYDRLVSREDQRGYLFAALMELGPSNTRQVVEFGAGTGRVTRLMSLISQRVLAFDIAPHMLSVAQEQLDLSGLSNWAFGLADNRAMPVQSGSADVAVQGWSFGHTVGWSPDNWRAEIGQMLSEMQRVLRPGGMAILMETMGTGNRQPAPPTEGLAELYKWWEQEHGFSYRWVRTDYQFESLAEAEELTRFFFGDELADRVVDEKLTILPECTGIWWRQYD